MEYGGSNIWFIGDQREEATRTQLFFISYSGLSAHELSCKTVSGGPGDHDTGNFDPDSGSNGDNATTAVKTLKKATASLSRSLRRNLKRARLNPGKRPKRAGRKLKSWNKRMKKIKRASSTLLMVLDTFRLSLERIAWDPGRQRDSAG